MRPDWENECVSKSALIEWLRPYLHTGEPIPADVLISDIQMMPPTLTPQNKPLTIEELREMDGQPVYIISKAHTISEWNIPKGVGEIVIAYDVPCAGMKSVIPSVEFFDGKNLSVEKYGSDWVAYRRPPEGEEA